MPRTYKFRTTNSVLYPLELPDGATVHDAKVKLAEITGNNVEVTKLIYHAKILQDSVVLDTLNIGENEHVIYYAGSGQRKAAVPTPAPSKYQEQEKITPKPAPAPEPVEKEEEPPKPAVEIVPERSTSPQTRPLPEFRPAAQQPAGTMSPIDITEPQYQAMINEIHSVFSFPRPEIESALKASRGNPELAVQFIESGHIPTEEEMQLFEKQSAAVEQMRAQLDAHPESLGPLIDTIQMSDPQAGAQIRADLPGFLRELRLDPSKFNLENIRHGPTPQTAPTQPLPPTEPPLRPQPQIPQQRPPQTPPPVRNPIQDALAMLTPQQRVEVNQIKDMFPQIPVDYIVQVYIACENQLENTVQVLLGDD